MDPDWEWRTLEANLLAAAADELSLIRWLNTDDAKRKNPRFRPKPIPRPGVHGYGRNKDTESLDLDEVKRRLALPRQALKSAA